jgi:hypothetical protein
MSTARTPPPLPKSASFPVFPTFAVWKKESRVGGAFSRPYRKEDKALVRIDRMVKSLNRSLADGERCYRLAGLFFTTLWWVNNHKYDPKMDGERRTAILSLNLTASRDLSRALRCGPGTQLSSRLVELYVTGMSEHGVQTDTRETPEYMTAAEREAYRVIFKDGRAYHFKYEVSGDTTMELLPHDTLSLTGAEADDNQRNGIMFVMSMSHRLYCGISGSGSVSEGHYAGMKKVTYHSCFLRGMPVLCAGTIDFADGKIVRIQNDSGHYQPQDPALAKMLQHLKTIGVDIRGVTVIQTKRYVDSRAGFVDRAKAADGELQYMQRDPKHFQSQIRTHVQRADTTGGKAALAAATCSGDVFLKHNGNWATILRTAGM